MYRRRAGKRTFFNRKRYAGVSLGQGEADDASYAPEHGVLRLSFTHYTSEEEIQTAKREMDALQIQNQGLLSSTETVVHPPGRAVSPLFR